MSETSIENPRVELGMRMWSILSDEFFRVAHEDPAVQPHERCLIWLGFLSSLAGGMKADLGGEVAEVVMHHAMEALKDINKQTAN